jgi:hypothetical protein
LANVITRLDLAVNKLSIKEGLELEEATGGLDDLSHQLDLVDVILYVQVIDAWNGDTGRAIDSALATGGLEHAGFHFGRLKKIGI